MKIEGNISLTCQDEKELMHGSGGTKHSGNYMKNKTETSLVWHIQIKQTLPLNPGIIGPCRQVFFKKRQPAGAVNQGSGRASKNETPKIKNFTH